MLLSVMILVYGIGSSSICHQRHMPYALYKIIPHAISGLRHGYPIFGNRLPTSHPTAHLSAPCFAFGALNVIKLLHACLLARLPLGTILFTPYHC
ncbi:hypothetical protein F5Y10DRAFT_127800 [Nemania abortiva]|nr:hypothetical protein F5Y10DRAFT_127800 [Nemania abortiva]